MALFHRGFYKYLESGKYSDLTLVHEGERYKVHKIVLVYSSEFFSRLLLSDFKEATQSEISLGFDDPDGVFKWVLKYMYTGEIPELSIENCVSILAMADHYLIKSLQTLCNDFIKKQVTRSNAFDVLKYALQFQSQDIVEMCTNLISKNFYLIPQDDYSQLPFEVFNKILQHKYLAVKDEHDVYSCICKYIKTNEDEINQKQIDELMSNIRFRWMTFSQLEECENNPLVPRSLIIESVMERLRKYEIADKVTDETQSNPRNQKRILCMTFEYQYDFDDRGILHYIATDGGVSKWQNPHLLGKVKLVASSIEVGNAADILNKVPSELWTKDVPASWFMIDFGPNRAVMPTHYTLRHGGNYKADSLRTWDLQGSVDGKNWSILKKHVHDISLGSKFATHTWELNLEKPTEYRYFRILQTGRNSSNHNFLVLSGVEFYGDLYEWKDND